MCCLVRGGYSELDRNRGAEISKVKKEGTETVESIDLKIGADSASRELFLGRLCSGSGFWESPRVVGVLLGSGETQDKKAEQAGMASGGVGVEVANREIGRADVRGGRDDVTGVGRDGNRSGGRAPRLRGRGLGVGQGRASLHGVGRGGAFDHGVGRGGAERFRG